MAGCKAHALGLVMELAPLCSSDLPVLEIASLCLSQVSQNLLLHSFRLLGLCLVSHHSSEGSVCLQSSQLLLRSLPAV